MYFRWLYYLIIYIKKNPLYGASQVAQWWRTHLPMQEMKNVGSIPGEEDPLGEEMAPVFLPGKFQGQRSL